MIYYLMRIMVIHLNGVGHLMMGNAREFEFSDLLWGKNNAILSFAAMGMSRELTHTSSPPHLLSSVIEVRRDDQQDQWLQHQYQGVLIMKDYALNNKYGVNIKVAMRDVCERSGACNYNEFVRIQIKE